jgi:hypothetical protein
MEWIQVWYIWYIVRTCVNTTMYPPPSTTIKGKKTHSWAVGCCLLMLIILAKLTILKINITNKLHFIAECLNYMRVCDTLWPLLLTFSTFSFNVCAHFFPTQSSHVLSEKQMIKKKIKLRYIWTTGLLFLNFQVRKTNWLSIV